jgi:hypothetical protein
MSFYKPERVPSASHDLRRPQLAKQKVESSADVRIVIHYQNHHKIQRLIPIRAEGQWDAAAPYLISSL